MAPVSAAILKSIYPHKTLNAWSYIRFIYVGPRTPGSISSSATPSGRRKWWPNRRMLPDWCLGCQAVTLAGPGHLLRGRQIHVERVHPEPPSPAPAWELPHLIPALDPAHPSAACSNLLKTVTHLHINKYAALHCGDVFSGCVQNFSFSLKLCISLSLTLFVSILSLSLPVSFLAILVSLQPHPHPQISLSLSVTPPKSICRTLPAPEVFLCIFPVITLPVHSSNY